MSTRVENPFLQDKVQKLTNNSYYIKTYKFYLLINKYTNFLKQSLKLKTMDCINFVFLLNDTISFKKELL